jgi:hypothetical protein
MYSCGASRLNWRWNLPGTARKARDVLPYIDLYPIATGNIGALEGYGPGLANTDGRSIVESCLIDM